MEKSSWPAGLGGMRWSPAGKQGNIAGVHYHLCRKLRQVAARKNVMHQGWVDVVDWRISWVSQPYKAGKTKTIGSFNSFHREYCRSMERFDQKIFLWRLKALIKNFTSQSLGRRYYPGWGHSFEESNELMSSNPELFKTNVSRKPFEDKSLQLIRDSQRKPYFYSTYGMAFLLRIFQEAGADVFASKWIDFQISFLRAGHLRTKCVLIMALDHLDGSAVQSTAEDLRK